MRAKQYTNHMSTRRRGFTLPEMLAVVAIVVIILSLLLPSIRRAREIARRAVCSSNLHQLNLAARNYRTDNGDFPQPWKTNNGAYYPPIIPDQPWLQYIDGREVYGCPSGRQVAHDLPNWDGNWPGPYTIGGFFYVGNLPALSPTGFNQWGLNEAKNSAEVCRKRDASSEKLLMTEGVQGWVNFDGGWSTIGGVYFAHGRNWLSFPAQAPIYEGMHNYAPAETLRQIDGWHRGYGDGHVAWTAAPIEVTDPITFWDTSWKYRHWIWAKWYW